MLQTIYSLQEYIHKFIYSGNNERYDSHRVLFNLTKKINLNKSEKYVTLSNLSIYCTWKDIKKPCKKNKLKISAAQLEWRNWIT